jgi:hypothetical protein
VQVSGAALFLDKLTVTQLVKTPVVMQVEGSLQRSQKPVTDSYCKPVKPSQAIKKIVTILSVRFTPKCVATIQEHMQ